MVTLDLKDNNRKISKGKIFTYNEIDQTPTYISFYSKQVESILPTPIDMKSPEQQEPKEILEEKENEENKDNLSKKPTWKGLKDINNAANRLTKKFTITGNGKNKSKDSMLAKIVSRKSSVQSIKEDKKNESGLIEEKEQVGDLEKKIEKEDENQILMDSSLISEKENSSPPSPTLSLDIKSKQNSKEISSIPSSPVENKIKQMSKDKNNKEILTSPSSPAENKIKTLSKDGLDPNDYSIICFETKIIVHKHKDKKVLNKVTVEEDRGRILTAKYVRNHENDILVCLTSKGFVDVYDLPELNFIHKTEIPLSETYNLNQCTITPDGRIFVNINPFELKQYCLYEDHDA
ncbi:hypothetical protein K502DRAFT_127061 [Neoconidiobolus thromboides FSU 785]|nr:hypothetical protein K502DRAFT_127061 [Neoconidiobolus thromboides FSU 785]